MRDPEARTPSGRGIWSPEKAPHEAIDAVRRTGGRSPLAGPMLDRAYFDREIRPRLGDHVRYAGHLDQRALCDLVGSSAVCGGHAHVGRALRVGGRRSAWPAARLSLRMAAVVSTRS